MFEKTQARTPCTSLTLPFQKRVQEDSLGRNTHRHLWHPVDIARPHNLSMPPTLLRRSFSQARKLSTRCSMVLTQIH